MNIDELKIEMSKPIEAERFHANAMRLIRLWRSSGAKENMFLERKGVLKEFVDEHLPIAQYCRQYYAQLEPRAIVRHIVGSQPYDAIVERGGALSTSYLEVTGIEDRREHRSRLDMATEGVGRLDFSTREVYDLAANCFLKKCEIKYPPMTTLLIYNKFPTPNHIDHLESIADHLRVAQSTTQCSFSSVFILNYKKCIKL